VNESLFTMTFQISVNECFAGSTYIVISAVTDKRRKSKIKSSRTSREH